jgi:Fe-S-cluster containining protein
MSRKRFVESEQKYPWLAPFLDTYYDTDRRIASYIAKKPTLRVACKAKCAACCKSNAILLNEEEIKGISWYLNELLSEAEKAPIRERIAEYQPGQLECIFLIGDMCSIYPVRPLTCRTFFVLNKPCLTGEDILKTRIDDILKLPQPLLHDSIRPLLKFWGYGTKPEQDDALEAGIVMERAHQMHEMNWRKFRIL